MGDNSTCHLVSGLFTKPHLSPGYSHITTIPRGACSITVRLATTSNNHAGNILLLHLLPYYHTLHFSALKAVSGSYIINKPGILSLTGEFEGVGTVFSYTRGDQDNKEILTADGPIDSPVELEVSKHCDDGYEDSE